MSNIFPVAFFDPPQVLNATVTNIPGSGSLPLPVVVDSGFNGIMCVDYIDTTGDYIGVYTGLSGHEVLSCIIGGGLTSRAWAVMPLHSRISLRSMSASAITNGYLTCTFLGARGYF